MFKFKRIGNEWAASDCLAFVRKTTAHDTATHDARHPYVVAWTDDGMPTGTDGQYETFRYLLDALNCAKRRGANRQANQ